MVQQMLQYGRGHVRIRVSGRSYERFLNMCAKHEIMIWDLECAGNAYEMNMTIRGFRKLRPMARKCGVRVRILEKSGLPFFLYRYRHRKMLFVGILTGLSLMLLLSCFIWDIRISGNQAITEDVIFDFLTQEEVCHGMWKSKVDCKGLAAKLRREFDDLIWVSARIQGTRLLIDVQENTDLELEEDVDYGPSDLVSNVSGTVVRIITRTGMPRVKAGDSVKNGDLLVEGRLEITDDAGEVTGYQYCAADADIYVKTAYHYHDSFPLVHQVKQYTGSYKKGYYLKLGDTTWRLARKQVPYQEYDAITQEHQLMLGPSFYLPISWGTIQNREYHTESVAYTKKGALREAESRLNKFISKIQEKGVQIFQNNVTIETDSENCIADGTIILIEKIGKRVERTTDEE